MWKISNISKSRENSVKKSISHPQLLPGHFYPLKEGQPNWELESSVLVIALLVSCVTLNKSVYLSETLFPLKRYKGDGSVYLPVTSCHPNPLLQVHKTATNNA